MQYSSIKLLLWRSWVYPVGVLHQYNFIISQLWLTSHPRSTVVLLDTGTPGTSREIFSEDADDGARTRNPSITNRVLYPSASSLKISPLVPGASVSSRTTVLTGWENNWAFHELNWKRGFGCINHCLLACLNSRQWLQPFGLCFSWKGVSQLRNDKIIMMQYTNWINSTPSQQQLNWTV